MANEATVVYGTPKTLEASGASTANNIVTQADDATYSVASDGASYPNGRFVLSFTTATAATENSVVSLFARALDIDGTNDAEVPESGTTNYKGRHIGSFVANNVTSAQYAVLDAFDLPPLASYYIDNQTGQTISAGWTLKVTPFTYKPGA